jgi:cytochrome o ubiquinol oxidase subunit 2
MKGPFLAAFITTLLLGFILFLTFLGHTSGFPLLAPSGAVGTAERDLMLHAVYLMLIVVVPVILLAIFIAWNYREGNTKAAYTPDWEQSRMEEFIWWSIPFEIVLVLAALTWSGTHALDPGKALASTEPPLVIEVVALPWKWLFIYPDEGIASLNEVAFPEGRPVEFRITADAPMNSFWIPALGGQMYAMTGMTTVLHLVTDHAGTYEGRSANYSGEGFAQMTFTARALSAHDYDAWVLHAKESPDALTKYTYAEIAKPSDAGQVRYYGSVSMSFPTIVDLRMPSLSHMLHH